MGFALLILIPCLIVVAMIMMRKRRAEWRATHPIDGEDLDLSDE